MSEKQVHTSLPRATKKKETYKTKETLHYLPPVTQIIHLWKPFQHYCMYLYQPRFESRCVFFFFFRSREHDQNLLCPPQANQRKWKIINIYKRKTKQTSTKNQLYFAQKENLSFLMHTYPSSKLCRTK